MGIIRIGDLIKKYRKALVVVGRVFAILVALVLVVFCNMLESLGEESFDFNAEFAKNLHSPLTWVLAISVSLAWLVFYTITYTTIKERKVNDNMNLFNKFDEVNKVRPNNFGDYLRLVINPYRKSKAYHDKMENALAKVQGQLEKIPLEKKDTKKYLKLKNKEQEIIRKSTPQYIEEHFLSLSVKYNRVTLEHFTFAITNTRVTDKTNSDESKKLGAKLFVKMISGVMISICGVSIFYSLKVIFNFRETGLWVTLIMIILTIFIQIYFATIDAENLVDSEIIAPTQTKIKIIEDSMLWEKADFSKNPFKKIVDDYVQEHLPKEEEKKQAKISMAELEYLQKHRDEINKEIEREVEEQGQQLKTQD